MDHEYSNAQAWVDAAAGFRAQGVPVESYGDAQKRHLGFKVGNDSHFITLHTVREASGELRQSLLTPEGRQKLLEG